MGTLNIQFVLYSGKTCVFSFESSLVQADLVLSYVHCTHHDAEWTFVPTPGW